MTFLNSLFGKNERRSTNIEKLSAAEFLIAVIDKGVQLVDVRTYGEYDNEHIKGAINIDWFQLFQFKRTIRKLDKERPVYVYCRTGDRSQKAARELAEFGFIKIYDLQGGISAIK